MKVGPLADCVQLASLPMKTIRCREVRCRITWNTNQLGKLSAEALVREYDAAVKEIEALGAELTEAANKCEAMVADCPLCGDEVKEAAGNYREEGSATSCRLRNVRCAPQ